MVQNAFSLFSFRKSVGNAFFRGFIGIFEVFRKAYENHIFDKI